jgi:hypothetical protein
MSFTIIPTGGPMWNEPLSEMRMKALVAVDSGPLAIPREVTEYIVALENRYHDMKAQDNREFLRSSWEARATPATPDAGVRAISEQELPATDTKS